MGWRPLRQATLDPNNCSHLPDWNKSNLSFNLSFAIFPPRHFLCKSSRGNKKPFQSHFLLRAQAILAQARSRQSLRKPGLPICQPDKSFVRRGWSQLDVPTGWVQIVRCPRPKSVTWPRATGGIQGVGTQTSSPSSGSRGGGFFVEGGQVGEGPRSVRRHGRPSLRGDAGRVEACQVCCSVATTQCPIGTVSVFHRNGQANLPFGSREGDSRRS